MARRYGPKDPFALVVDRAALNALLSGEQGPVAFEIAKRAQRVAASARRRAPKDTGALKASIGWEIAADEDGVYADIGSDLLYARFVEQGHRAPDGSRVSPRRYLRSALFAGRRPRRR